MVSGEGPRKYVSPRRAEQTHKRQGKGVTVALVGPLNETQVHLYIYTRARGP